MSNTITSCHFENFVADAIEPILFCDYEGRIIIWNRGCQTLFEYSQDEIQRYSIFSLIDPGHSDSFMMLFEVVKKGRTLSFETQCIDRKSSVFDVEVTSGVFKNGDENCIYCIFRDISRVRKNRDKMKSFSSFAESSPDFIMEWDRFQGITYYNQAVRAFFEETAKESIHLEKILPANFENYMRRIVGTDRSIREVEVKFEDHIFSYIFTPFKMDENKILIIGKNVTFRKNLEEEIDSAYGRTKNILDFIENILREFRFINLEEKIDLKPLINLFLRDIHDSVSLNPTHIFFALENDERLLEGFVMHKKHGELQMGFDTLLLHPNDLKKVVSERGDVIYSSWYDEYGDIASFQTIFPENLCRNLPEIRNFASYRITGERGGVFIAFNYAKDVNKYDAETIKGLAVAVGTLYSVQAQFREKEEAQFVTITKMAELAEKRDRETGEHLKRMRNYARIIAEEMSHLPKYRGIIDRDFIRRVYNSAPLHDIGKVGIPDSILQKPGKLDEKEYEAMRDHTLIGGKVLEGPKFLEMAKEIAYYHHEKYDGSGYPYGVKGEEIPLSARIVAIADVYDAMTSKRVYKEAFSHDRSKKLIAICSGGHFDPDVVNAFLAREQDFIRIKEIYKD